MFHPFKIGVTFFLLSVATSAYGQMLFSEKKDTLLYESHTGGESDTMDLSLSNAVSTLPGTGFNNTYNTANFYWFYGQMNRFALGQSQLHRTFTFSALPHLGFSYAFGSKGTQTIHTNYSQGFKNGGLINLQLVRQSSNGFMRNSNFANSDLWLGYHKQQGRLWTLLKATYQSDDRSLYGGSADTINFLTFGADYARTSKASAFSNTRIGNILLENRLNFTGDSSIVKTGLLIQNGLTLHNRVYQESDTLFGLYPTINIDSNSTRDQFQENSLRNGAGYFFQTNRFELSGQIYNKYRRLQNLGATRDTNEVSIDASTRLYLGKFEVKGFIYQNFIGAKGESSIKANASYRQGKWHLVANAQFDRVLPTLQQRQYFANNLSYKTSLDLQESFLTVGRVQYTVSSQLEVRAEGGLVARQNVLVWQNDQWIQSGLSNDKAAFLKINPVLRYRSIALFPFAEYTKGSVFLPEWSTGGRLLFKKKVFKQQKLLLTLAADLIYNQGYQNMAYSTLLDVYQIGTTQANALTSVHGTFGLSIEEFRFYLRMENINRMGLIQGNSSNYLVSGYFASPFALKVGVTWDFFN